MIGLAACIQNERVSGAGEVAMIKSAMRTMSFVSCIKFKEWDGTQKDYIHFKPDKKRKG